MIEHVKLNVRKDSQMDLNGNMIPSGKYHIFIEIQTSDEYDCDKTVKEILGALGE